MSEPRKQGDAPSGDRAKRLAGRLLPRVQSGEVFGANDVARWKRQDSQLEKAQVKRIVRARQRGPVAKDIRENMNARERRDYDTLGVRRMILRDLIALALEPAESQRKLLTAEQARQARQHQEMATEQLDARFTRRRAANNNKSTRANERSH